MEMRSLLYLLAIFFYNLEQNIYRLFHVLAQFLFTTSETEIDYYHQKVDVRVISRVTERNLVKHELRATSHELKA